MEMARRRSILAGIAAAVTVLFAAAEEIGVSRIVIAPDEHPAVVSAAEILAKRLDLPMDAIVRRPGRATQGGEVRLAVAPRKELRHDGYVAVREGDGVAIFGSRPRSLLYAAYELARWRATRLPFARDPAFAARMLNYGSSKHSLGEWLAATGCNIVHLGRRGTVTLERSMPEVFARLSAADRARMQERQAKERKSFERTVRMCTDMDVPAYPLLYGCDARKWDSALLEAFLQAHPSAKGESPLRSWEKGTLCPSDPATRVFLGAYIAEFAQLASYEGVIVTFWDDYGLNCQCRRCRKNGLHLFSRQVAFCIGAFEDALKPIGKKLIVRTWSSGASHFLNDEWVHAPGYGGPSGEPLELWGTAFRKSSKETVFQTKVYNSDCQPEAPFSLLLGSAKGRREFAEWQIAGQTVGLQWLPASVVDHTARTVKRAYGLVGGEGGVCLYAGGYNNPGYEALDDIVNGINLHAWRQLTWNPDDSVDDVWMEWAKTIYGAAAKDVASALKETERISVQAFSPLGLGAPTESRFANSIARREDLLRYTNRCHLPDGRAALEPTKENVARVAAEKNDCLARLDRADAALARAGARLSAQQRAELATRFGWLREFVRCARALDVALWQFRLIRHLSAMQQSCADELKPIDEAFGEIRAHGGMLFRHDPSLRLSCFPDPVGERPVTLGSPVPLMRDIYTNAVKLVEKVSGPQKTR